MITAAKLSAWVQHQVESHQWVRRLLPWAISIVSLTLGFMTLFVFRRGLPHVSWIVGYLLLVVLLLTVLAEVRAPIEQGVHRLVVGAGEYLLQTLCHGLFLFVLPAYYAAATLTSPNGVFVLLLAVAALLTTIDPWYRAIVHPRPSLRTALIGLAMFAGLNVAIALLGLRSFVAAIAAAGLAALALAPALRPQHRPHGWSRAVGLAAAIAITAMAAVWVDPIWVPPAPMFMARAVIARDVIDHEPIDPVDGAIEAATILRWRSLAAYTAIYAPAGMHQALEHVWRRNGSVVGRIPLTTPVLGGRREGFRTFSRRRNWRAPIAGRYRVDVLTTSGQLIGRVTFTIVP